MKTVTTEQMRAIDERAIRDLGIPSLELMEHAAAHTAQAVLEILGGRPEGRVLILCGTGNNGGDGLACARLLSQQGIHTEVILAGNAEKCTPDARENARLLETRGVPIVSYTGQMLPDCSCIVDALFGFGLNREVTGAFRELIEKINASPAPVVACDIPSGLNGNTGYPMGVAVRADRTVTFTCAKVGLVMEHAGSYVGRLTVADIGIPRQLLDAL